MKDLIRRGRLRRFRVLDSTQDEAIRRARVGAPDGTVIVANRQTRGRGRFGRCWESPRGGLWFSVIHRPSSPGGRGHLGSGSAAPWSIAAGLAVAEAVESLGLAPRLKWPNDVLVNGKKVAGILVESVFQDGGPSFVVVGFGVNLNNRPPRGTDRPAASLCRILGRRLDPDEVLARILAGWDRWKSRPASENLRAWRRYRMTH